MSDRVLVVLDREDAEDAQAELEHLDAHRLSHRLTAREVRHRDALRAALDTDREALARRLAEALDPSGWRLLDASDRDMATAEVEAVLALLEGADDE